MGGGFKDADRPHLSEILFCPIHHSYSFAIFFNTYTHTHTHIYLYIHENKNLGIRSGKLSERRERDEDKTNPIMQASDRFARSIDQAPLFLKRDQRRF